jgi:tetratricopeptide (TPR) repeat protein
MRGGWGPRGSHVRTGLVQRLLRYVQVALLLEPPCIAREVAPRAATDPVALASLAVIVAVTAAAARLWRRGHRLPLIAVALFAAGLAPVSQVLAPLQNRMADRYLLVAALGPCLAVAAILDRVAWRRALTAATLLAAAGLSVRHAAQFGDEPWLWSDAMARTRGPLAPYQLAHLLRARGDLPGTERMLREALARDGMRTPASASAATNLSQLLAVSGRSDEAISLLRRAIVASPGNPPGALQPRHAASSPRRGGRGARRAPRGGHALPRLSPRAGRVVAVVRPAAARRAAAFDGALRLRPLRAVTSLVLFELRVDHVVALLVARGRAARGRRGLVAAALPPRPRPCSGRAASRCGATPSGASRGALHAARRRAGGHRVAGLLDGGLEHRRVAAGILSL